MNSEEKLNQLFTHLKEERASTTVSEITSWISSAKPTPKIKPTNHSILLKLIIMSSIITTTLIGSFILFSDKKEIKPISINSSAQTTNKKEISLDSASLEKVEQVKNYQLYERNSLSSYNPVSEIKKDSIISTLVNSFDVNLITANIPPVTKEKKSVANRGSWVEINNSLKVDTIFDGIKKIVFRGNHNDKIQVEGSNRKDVSFNYLYEKKHKGLIKNKGTQHEVSFEIKDSVLTIRSLTSGKDFVFVGVISTKDSVKFVIPQNIPIDIKTDYGNISASSLEGSSVQLNTSYGDLFLNNCSGAIDLKSDFGDLKLTELSGKIDALTNFGNIKGKKITAKEHCFLGTNYGDIDIHLLNPIKDCTLELKTEFGSVKSKREDFSFKGNQFKFGTGTDKISLKTDFGNVIIR